MLRSSTKATSQAHTYLYDTPLDGGVSAAHNDATTTHHMERERKRMSAEDKLSNKIDDMGGKAKEAAGRLTGDDSTKNEGKLDQAKASLKDAGEKVKDAFKN